MGSALATSSGRERTLEWRSGTFHHFSQLVGHGPRRQSCHISCPSPRHFFEGLSIFPTEWLALHSGALPWASCSAIRTSLGLSNNGRRCSTTIPVLISHSWRTCLHLTQTNPGTCSESGQRWVPVDVEVGDEDLPVPHTSPLCQASPNWTNLSEISATSATLTLSANNSSQRPALKSSKTFSQFLFAHMSASRRATEQHPGKQEKQLPPTNSPDMFSANDFCQCCAMQSGTGREENVGRTSTLPLCGTTPQHQRCGSGVNCLETLEPRKLPR